MITERLFFDVLDIIIDSIFIVLNNSLLFVALFTCVPGHNCLYNIRIFALVERVQEVGLAIDGGSISDWVLWLVISVVALMLTVALLSLFATDHA